jgi:uncharacterized membrane protein YphA (DoxX/SURF4 family)
MRETDMWKTLLPFSLRVTFGSEFFLAPFEQGRRTFFKGFVIFDNSFFISFPFALILVIFIAQILSKDDPLYQLVWFLFSSFLCIF